MAARKPAERLASGAVAQPGRQRYPLSGWSSQECVDRKVHVLAWGVAGSVWGVLATAAAIVFSLVPLVQGRRKTRDASAIDARNRVALDQADEQVADLR